MATKVSVKQREYVIQQANAAIERKKLRLLTEAGHSCPDEPFVPEDRAYEMRRYKDRIAKQIIVSGVFNPRPISKTAIRNRVKERDSLSTFTVYDLTDVNRRVIMAIRKDRRIEATVRAKLKVVNKKFEELKRTAMLMGAEEITEALTEFEKTAK